MSSDYEFDDLDPETLTQLDYLESTQLAPTSTQPSARPSPAPTPAPPPAPATRPSPAPASGKFQPSRSISTPTGIFASTFYGTSAPARPPVRKQPARPPSPIQPAAADSDDYDQFFDGDESTDFARIDAMVEDVYAGRPVVHEPPPVAGPSKPRTFARVQSFGGQGGRQTTLDGGLVPEKPPSRPNGTANGNAHGPLHRVQSAPTEMARNRKTKKWDHTVFSKTGRRKGAKGKGKARGGDEENEEEEIEFEQFPAPFINPSIAG
ncbi:hypothetical protein PENSPDRAFT_679210 [Peniophora sp. CONT]|nr:hypothetical protein PENSPDRAFT_679210 [Peniophora sp. CONT]